MEAMGAATAVVRVVAMGEETAAEEMEAEKAAATAEAATAEGEKEVDWEEDLGFALDRSSTFASPRDTSVAVA